LFFFGFDIMFRARCDTNTEMLLSGMAEKSGVLDAACLVGFGFPFLPALNRHQHPEAASE
jgi:hypothetical protein